MPAGAFQQDSVGIRINNLADLLTLRAHGLAVAPGHDQAGAVALGRADRPEEVGPICDLIVRDMGARSASSSAPAEGVLLTNPSLVQLRQLEKRAGRQLCPDRVH
jgi:hypothetical protein